MRRPKPWFRTSKNAWYVQHHGKKVLLGEHPEGGVQRPGTDLGLRFAHSKSPMPTCAVPTCAMPTCAVPT